MPRRQRRDKDSKLRGMRVDPSYLYGAFYSALGATDSNSAADLVIRDAISAGVDTLFIRAYNTVAGAFYLTTYADTTVERGHGRGDILRLLTQKAHTAGINTVAWLPVNDYKEAWLKHPEWRSKKRNGLDDYQPQAETFLLCCWHDDFRSWYCGLLRDLMNRHPLLHGIEAGEGMVDYFWDSACDYNPVSNAKYLVHYPSGTPGDMNWKGFRAQGLKGLHQILSSEAHTAGKKSYVVQTWTVRSDTTGTLMDSGEIRDGSGFDFDGILNLSGTGRPDYIIGELMWQQWNAELDNPLIDPDWTLYAVKEFVRKVAGRALPVAHVELSGFKKPNGNKVTPTRNQFGTSLKHAYTAPSGADFYDYNLMKRKGVLDIVRSVFNT